MIKKVNRKINESLNEGRNYKSKTTVPKLFIIFFISENLA